MLQNCNSSSTSFSPSRLHLLPAPPGLGADRDRAGEAVGSGPIVQLHLHFQCTNQKLSSLRQTPFYFPSFFFLLLNSIILLPIFESISPIWLQVKTPDRMYWSWAETKLRSAKQIRKCYSCNARAVGVASAPSAVSFFSVGFALSAKILQESAKKDGTARLAGTKNDRSLQTRQWDFLHVYLTNGVI